MEAETVRGEVKLDLPELEFSPSWYDPAIHLTPREKQYLLLTTNTFNMRGETGRPVPYIPTKYQTEFHQESLNVKGPDAKDILFVKARGVSFTFSSAIEIINTAALFDAQTIPVIAQRQKAANYIISICKWLINNSRGDLKNRVDIRETEIRFNDTDSVIGAYPSGSAADAVRSLRIMRALVDEYAFQQKDKELLTAVQDAMIGDMSQIIIGSTPCGRQNHFFELVEKPVGFKVFRLPVFDERLVKLHQPLIGQKLIPVAPWINFNKLEIKRLRDLEIFKQEQMCDFLDDSLSYIPYTLIMRCTNEKLVNKLFTMEKDPDWIYETDNPMYAGQDFARTSDFSSITIFEKMFIDDVPKMVERFIVSLRNVSTPDQETFVLKLFNRFPTMAKYRLDATGNGLGLYEYLRKAKGSIIEGIQFSERLRSIQQTSELGESLSKAERQMKTPIKERMATNLKRMLQDDAVELIKDDMQIKHLNAVDYDLGALRSAGSGHGDLFWAVAMALLPENYRQQRNPYASTDTHMGKKKGPVVLSVEEVVKVRDEELKKPVIWDQHLKDLRQRKRTRSMRRLF